ncbi:hypothetical protein FA15DRAFT_682960 [Coprinopsis marcescibilis]|uniref:Uncharacterized protein n=1 Tax=Coprinopsis marcescibilis TaxID=230819 RepID=A0A5C3KHL8_COPMA|nr:hypothetical protein FA15DRAFT_682960 [Coprinopsis marcescibilis]
MSDSESDSGSASSSSSCSSRSPSPEFRMLPPASRGRAGATSSGSEGDSSNSNSSNSSLNLKRRRTVVDEESSESPSAKKARQLEHHVQIPSGESESAFGARTNLKGWTTTPHPHPRLPSLSTLTHAGDRTRSRAIPALDDLAVAKMNYTRSKVMNIQSLAASCVLAEGGSSTPKPEDREQEEQQQQSAPVVVTLEDWEDSKEVWGRCLEVVDVEEPSETLPLLRGIIHECSRFLQVYEDPSVLFLNPALAAATAESRKSSMDGRAPIKVHSAVNTSPMVVATPSTSTESVLIPNAPPPPPQAAAASKDLPTAFHALLGTALFFFGNLIGANPHLALEGEPRSVAFYHLYALDVFEMGERLPARTGSGYGFSVGAGFGNARFDGEGNVYVTGVGGGLGGGVEGLGGSGAAGLAADQHLAHVHAHGHGLGHYDCCGLGSKEDWRMAITWGRTIVSLAEELLERERMCEDMEDEWERLQARASEQQSFVYGYRQPAASMLPARPQMNPSGFLAEDFIVGSGQFVVGAGGGYFSGTGGRGMGFSVDGLGVLRVDVDSRGGAVGSDRLPSALYALEREGRVDVSSPGAGVSGPLQGLSLDTPGVERAGGEREDPRVFWTHDCPFVMIRSRMPPVTRRMTLGGGGDGKHGREGGGFSEWWAVDEEEGDDGEGCGGARVPFAVSGGDDEDVERKKQRKKQKQKQKEKQTGRKRRAGVDVDAMMKLAVDQFSRGILHMPRSGEMFGGVGVGRVVDAEGKKGKRHHHHHHHHGHHHHHHHHHRRRHRSAGEGGKSGAVSDQERAGAGEDSEPGSASYARPSVSEQVLAQPFSRATHLLTIALEVLLLAEKLPEPGSRYKWATYAESVFEQMRLEESPGAGVVVIRGEGRSRRERREDRMDVDEAVGGDEDVDMDEDRERHAHSGSGSRHRHSHSVHRRQSGKEGLEGGEGGGKRVGGHGVFLDSNNNAVILKARGRCALIVGSAVAEEDVECFLEGSEDEDEGGSVNAKGKPKVEEKGKAEVKVKLEEEREEQKEAKRKEVIEKVLRSEDAEEARRKLREANMFLERARSVWRESVGERRREREVVGGEILWRKKERARKAAVAQRALPVGEVKAGEGKKKVRRGIGAVAAQNKRRKMSSEGVFEGMQVDADDVASFGVREGEGGVLEEGVRSEPKAKSASPVQVQGQVEDEGEVRDAELLALFRAEEGEEEEEEKEFARLIAECVLTLANILPGGGEECEREREELYRVAKEEGLRGGVGDVVAEVYR